MEITKKASAPLQRTEQLWRNYQGKPERSISVFAQKVSSGKEPVLPWRLQKIREQFPIPIGFNQSAFRCRLVKVKKFHLWSAAGCQWWKRLSPVHTSGPGSSVSCPDPHNLDLPQLRTVAQPVSAQDKKTRCILESVIRMNQFVPKRKYLSTHLHSVPGAWRSCCAIKYCSWNFLNLAIFLSEMPIYNVLEKRETRNAW